MPSASHLLTFTLAAFVLIVIPGPSVLFTVGRALSYGRREALPSCVSPLGDPCASEGQAGPVVSRPRHGATGRVTMKRTSHRSNLEIL